MAKTLTVNYFMYLSRKPVAFSDDVSQYGNVKLHPGLYVLDAMNVAATEGADYCEGLFLDFVARTLIAGISSEVREDVVQMEVEAFARQQRVEIAQGPGKNLKAYYLPSHLRYREKTAGGSNALHTIGD
jgi:hypothetical protein